jgi:ABC-type spermidine/putrescine transport system permease subunit I
MTDNDPIEMFKSGKLAMWYDGSYDAAQYNKTEGLNADVAPLPAGPKGKATVIHGLANVIYAKTEHPEQAWEFLKFLGSEQANRIQAESGAVIPAYEGLQDSWVKSMPKLNLQAFIDQLPDARPYPVSKNTAAWARPETDAITKAFSDGQDVEAIARGPVAGEVSTLGRAVAAEAAARPATRRRLRDRDWVWGYAMIAPLVLGLGLFYLWPVAQSVYFSFTEWTLFGDATWIGLRNYEQVLTDPANLRALRNTFVYGGLSLLGIPLSIAVAALLGTRGLKLVSLYRTLYFLPVVTMPAAVAMIWTWLYNGDYGLVNYLLSLVGVEGTSWIANPSTALYALVAVGVWTQVGYNAVIFMAGLQAIPRHLYEAAPAVAQRVLRVRAQRDQRPADVRPGLPDAAPGQPGPGGDADHRLAVLLPRLRGGRQGVRGGHGRRAHGQHPGADRRPVPGPEEVGALCVTAGSGPSTWSSPSVRPRW